MIKLITLIITLLLVGCASRPPSKPNDICSIFMEKRDWYKSAMATKKKWQLNPDVSMAIISQESNFLANAKPGRKRILGFIPGPRKSSAYGFAQALKPTWKRYKEETGRWFANRASFSDAMDFVGWYSEKSVKINRINRNNGKHLYLAYHEGHTGYAKKTHLKKKWLLNVSNKVAKRSYQYKRQLTKCKKKIKLTWFERLF